MRKFNRIMSMVLCSIVGVSACVSGGCVGKGGSEDPNVLDVYCFISGYRDSWLRSALDLFEEQDWVKEKYPDLEINYTSDSLEATAHNKLNTPSKNDVDLFFSSEIQKYINVSNLADLTDCLYLKTVPGEDVKVIDKVPDYVKDVLYTPDAPEREDGLDTYYVMKYVDSFYGMMYNADKLQQLNLEVPVTTDELLEQIKYVEDNGYKYTYKGAEETCYNGLMVSGPNSYAQWMFPLYWTQYEGYDQYVNYFNGEYYNPITDEYTMSPEIFTQTGRLRALEFIEELLKDHANEDAKDINHTKAQTNFLVGNGLFHWNGDYFSSEMELTRLALKNEEGVDYDLRFMQAPVLSSIVEVLEDKEMSDTTLREVVREIDKEKSYEESTVKQKVSKNDYNRIIEARRVRGNWMLFTQDAVIPKDCPAEELASDFLAFMFSDIAIRNFSENSYGLSFPAIYYENMDSDEYEEMTAHFDSVQKSKFDIMFKYKTYPTIKIPSESSFLLGKKGLSRITSYKGVMGTTFVMGTDTAKNIYEKDIRYWYGLDKDTEINKENLDKAPKSEWANLLKLAGYQ